MPGRFDQRKVWKVDGLKFSGGKPWRSLGSVILSLGLVLGFRSPAAAILAEPTADTMVLPASVPDPIEPFNRAMWVFNREVLRVVIQPTSRVYRLVIVKPVRNCIGNFGRNLTYPGRLINNLLQEKWPGARDETSRFLCNSTVGVLGLFDVGTRWKIPKSDADFGQTLGQWGWRPQCYLMLPIFGPSNERDTVGLAADSAADPLLYISPYRLVADNPLTYLGPYSYFTYAVMYNNLSDKVDEAVRFSQSEADPYSEIQYAWTFVRANRVADFQVKGRPDPTSLETLESVFFTYQNPDFPDMGRTLAVRIPATGKHLKFTCWMQPGRAPVVYIVPGLGAHRMEKTALAMAELVFKHGFSAVCLSSPFHPEFMEHAGTTALPGYLPVDGHDLQVALTGVGDRLQALYPGRMGAATLLGYSMGAQEILYVAATAPTNTEPLLRFDRYLAISPPVRLLHGVDELDGFFRAPLEWPAAERNADMENTFLKVAALSQAKLTPETTLPFSSIESRFLVGLVFRFTLRDTIYSSQHRHNLGILHHALWDFRRDPVNQEILGFSFRDYFDRFVVPYYQDCGLAAPVAQTIQTGGDLHTYEAALRNNPALHIIVNQNDFLLSDDDLSWLRATFSKEKLTIFPQGGHLGNLSNPNVQKTVLSALAGWPTSSAANQ